MADSAFDRIAAAVDPPMVIVTARAGDDVDGCLVGFSTQCSIDPSRYLVCLSKTNKTYEIERNWATTSATRSMSARALRVQLGRGIWDIPGDAISTPGIRPELSSR